MGGNSHRGWLGKDSKSFQKLLEQQTISPPHMVLQVKTAAIQLRRIVAGTVEVKGYRNSVLVRKAYIGKCLW